MNTKSLLVGLASGMLVGQACGQLAPPPPKEKTRQKVTQRPPPRQVVEERPAQPAQPAQRARPQGPATPDIAFESLVKNDEAGIPIPIQGQLTMAALKNNPLVGPETIAVATPVVIEWIEGLELMVIDNIDMVLEVDAGFFEKLNLTSEEGVMDAQAYRSALMPKPSLLDSFLFSNGVLTDAQRKFTSKLVSEYIQATTISIGAQVEGAHTTRITEANGGVVRELTPEERTALNSEFFGKAAAFSFWYLCSDSVWSMHQQLAFASQNMLELQDGLELNEDELNVFKRTVVALRQTNDPAERRELMVELITPWEFENQESLLLGALELRGPLESIPELEAAAIKPEGTPLREDLKDWMPGQSVAPPASADGGGDGAGDGGG